jgi:hypothetical protein
MPEHTESRPQKATVITLTLPESDSDSRDGTLLIQRGDLARLHQFTYTRIADLSEIIADALIALADVEANPPVIAETLPGASAPARNKKASPSPEMPPIEPTVDIPLKKGKKAVRISHLKLIGGETDAAAYRQAVQIASVLIDGRLWDGDTLIRIDDVYALAKKMKHLTAKDMALFSLEDFVQVGSVEPEPAADQETSSILPPQEFPHSANGASAQTTLL